MIPSIGRKLIISLIISVFLLGIIVFEGTKARVTISIDGVEEIVRTHANTVEDLLLSYGNEWNELDKVSPALNTSINSGMTITWNSAQKVKIIIGQEEKEIWTAERKVKDILKQENYTLSENDKVTPNINEKITDDSTIIVEKAFPIAVNIGGEAREIWTTSTTVADFLKQQEIELNKLDRVEPDLHENVNEDTEVKVVRVEKVTDVVEEQVDYAVVTRRDSSLTAGNERVIDPGEKGLVKKHYEVVLENGKEISRELIKKEQVKESKDKIVALGTKQLDATIARGSGEVAKEMYMEATAYTAYCTGCSGTTRTGINLRKNPHLKVIAVDPKVIPLGTKVWVEGYGYAIAGDTGGAIKGNRIDLFIPDLDKVYKFGRQKVKVKILE